MRSGPFVPFAPFASFASVRVLAAVLAVALAVTVAGATLPAQRMPSTQGNSGFSGVDPRSREILLGPRGCPPSGCRITGVG